MNEDAYVISIFDGKSQFTFSRHPMLDDLNKKELSNLRSALNDSAAKIFPLKYETDILDSKGELIAGTFSLPGDAG